MGTVLISSRESLRARCARGSPSACVRQQDPACSRRLFGLVGPCASWSGVCSHGVSVCSEWLVSSSLFNRYFFN